MLSAKIKTVYINDDPDHCNPYGPDGGKVNWEKDSLEDSSDDSDDNTIVLAKKPPTPQQTKSTD